MMPKARRENRNLSKPTERKPPDRPPVEPLGPVEILVPQEALEQAKALTRRDQQRLKRRLASISSAGAKRSRIDELLVPPRGDGEEADQRFIELLALILLLGEAAEVADCACSKEQAALVAAQQALAAAQQAFAQAQAALAADQAQLAAAQAAEAAAWKAYQATSKLVKDVCSGIGKIDPLCLVAITYEVMVGNKWAARFKALQAWQVAVAADLAMVALRQAALIRSARAFAQALNDYLLCLARCT